MKKEHFVVEIYIVCKIYFTSKYNNSVVIVVVVVVVVLFYCYFSQMFVV